MTDFYKFIKFDKILENIRPHVQAVSPKAYLYWSVLINSQMDRAHIEGVQRCVLVRINGK